MGEKNNKILFKLLDKYKLSSNEKEYILTIIKDIYNHDEFQRRLTNEFPHHDTITLGEHILEVTIVTYLLSKKKDKKDYDIDTSLNIAMMHDLYTLPWQNNPAADVDKFINKHGFRHPIEAVINSLVWYSELFTSLEKSKIIIDGIVHHMYPFPVTAFNSDGRDLELKNYHYIKNIDSINKELLVWSSNRFKVGKISICPSKYSEGRVMSMADKIVSFSNLKHSGIDSTMALITGKNKKLEKLK